MLLLTSWVPLLLRIFSMIYCIAFDSLFWSGGERTKRSIWLFHLFATLSLSVSLFARAFPLKVNILCSFNRIFPYVSTSLTVHGSWTHLILSSWFSTYFFLREQKQEGIHHQGFFCFLPMLGKCVRLWRWLAPMVKCLCSKHEGSSFDPYIKSQVL